MMKTTRVVGAVMLLAVVLGVWLYIPKEQPAARAHTIVESKRATISTENGSRTNGYPDFDDYFTLENGRPHVAVAIAASR